MSDNHHCCQKPENLDHPDDSLKNWTSEQVHICHGDDLKEHPCACRQREQKTDQ